MSTPSIPKDPYLKELHCQIEPIKDHARQLATGLDHDQLNWKPAKGSWSVGQCLEHIVIAAELYYERMDEVIARAEKSDDSSGWRPSLMGRMLIKSVTTSRRLKRPGRFAPPAQARNDILELFLASQDRLAGLLCDADGAGLSSNRVTSPAARWLRLNLGDCFTMLVLHAKRHLKQAARVAESRRFPKGSGSR